LGSRKGIRPAKELNGKVLAWLSVWSEIQMICVVQLMPLPPLSSVTPVKSRMFTFLVPAYPGCPGKMTVKGCSAVVVVPSVVKVRQSSAQLSSATSNLSVI